MFENTKCSAEYQRSDTSENLYGNRFMSSAEPSRELSKRIAYGRYYSLRDDIITVQE